MSECMIERVARAAHTYSYCQQGGPWVVFNAFTLEVIASYEGIEEADDHCNRLNGPPAR